MFLFFLILMGKKLLRLKCFIFSNWFSFHVGPLLTTKLEILKINEILQHNWIASKYLHPKNVDLSTIWLAFWSKFQYDWIRQKPATYCDWAQLNSSNTFFFRLSFFSNDSIGFYVIHLTFSSQIATAHRLYIFKIDRNLFSTENTCHFFVLHLFIW